MATRAKTKAKKVTSKPSVRRVVKQKTTRKVVARKTTKKSSGSGYVKTESWLQRSHTNPILTPSEQHWESRATFNPAAAMHDDKVHMLYRAVGADDRSVLGYAASDDGFSVHHRSSVPVYGSNLQQPSGVTIKIPYSSGGGTNGGCEDPRMTIIGSRAYLIYTSFDGWGSLRLAMSSISLADFIKQKWNWKQPVMISPPGQIHKNWVLFPEKINGQYALLHSISPEIQIVYFDDLNHLDGAHFVQSAYRPGTPRKGAWDSWVRGAGPPPMKTKYGWLLLYHAMDFRDPNRYKLGAMLLDLKDPTKILYRAQEPILEPDEWYENHGFKSGVVYSCGAVIKDGQLLVYYGGADTVVCVAAAPIDWFLEQLLAKGSPKLTMQTK